MQPEIETEDILDEGTKREQRVMDSVRACMRDVYAMRGCMCRQVGAMQCGLCRYGTLRKYVRTGRYALCSRRGLQMGVLCTILVKNWLIKPIFLGIVDILYDGFRKCFVNCKFTFYITLSSYLKKVKIPKTRKNHSKM